MLAGDRELREVALAEVSAGHVGAGRGQHPGGRIHPEDRVAELSEVPRVPAGAARGVERRAGREPVEEAPDHRLLQVEQVVVLAVVPRGPHVVALGYGHRAALRRLPGLVQVAQQGPDLGEPGQREVAAVLTVERPQQRQALQAQQVAQRMLIDHA